MLAQYYTVKHEGVDQQTIQKSRFIGYVRRTESEDAAVHFIEEIKKKHHDATHNCSAYLIGEQNEIQKANDDGEPSGTAGMPILEVLKKQQLKDTSVVVTRYFGGIKLGAGGLIRAYGSTTTQALQATGLVKRKLNQGFSMIIDYALLGKVENELRQSEFYLSNIRYLEKAELIVYVETVKTALLKDFIADLTNGQVILKEIDLRYLETNL